MRPSVLIVEDDAAIREVYALKFELEKGYTVMAAENGVAALAALKTFTPDLILLDMMMPVMGGLEFLKSFQGQALPGEVIVFSNLSAPDQVRSMMDLGATDYWIKSDFTPDMAIERVRRHWQKRRPASGTQG